MKTDKLNRLEENLKILKSIKDNYSLDDMISNKENQAWAIAVREKHENYSR